MDHWSDQMDHWSDQMDHWSDQMYLTNEFILRFQFLINLNFAMKFD